MLYRIAIGDDKQQVITSLSEELISTGQVEVVLTAHNGEEYLDRLNQLPENKRPQVVLMDLDMPVMNGIEAVRIGSALYENVQYIMFTVFDSDDNLFEALKAGADGYLLKEETAEDILEAIIEVVEKKGAPMSSSIARKTLNMLISNAAKSAPEPVVASNLSDREIEILKSMVHGLDYKQTAKQLFLSPHTVRNHISSIYQKLHISSKIEAVKMAIKNRWV